jgi:uncharacterized damage-inducible protein DinB
MHRSDFPARDVIINELEEVYRGPAWHGPSLLEALNEVDASAAARRFGGSNNSIWDLVGHLTHGRHLLIERLTQTTFDFPGAVREPWWPVAKEDLSEASWRQDLRLLDEYHERLIASIRAATHAQLARVPAPGDQSLAQQLLGMAVHDAYHAGQIRLIALA